MTIRPGLLFCAPFLAAVCVPTAYGCATFSCKPKIEQADAATMLRSFSEQTGFQLYFDADVTLHAKLRPVQGKWHAIDSLNEMLRGSGLGYRFLSKGEISIEADPGVGADAANPLSQVVVQGRIEPERPGEMQLSRADIALTGLNSIQDVLQTYPQVAGGVCEGDLSNQGRDQQSNSTLGCGVNMRGLGPDATVVVVNGRRIAPSGTGGLFVDVSHIPLVAIERVDLLPDGSSVMYGADAIAGTVNFVLREKFDGWETDLHVSPGFGATLNEGRISQLFGKTWGRGRYLGAVEYYSREALPAALRAQATSDLVRFGGNNYGSVFGDPGTIQSGADTWPVPAFRPGATPEPKDFTKGAPNIHDIRQDTDILPRESRLGAYFSGALDFDGSGELFGDLLVTQRKVTSDSTAVGMLLTVTDVNPYYVSPTGGTGPIEVYDGFLRALGPTVLTNDVWDGALTIGGSHSLRGGWELSGYVGYSFEWQSEAVRNLINPYALDDALAGDSTSTAFNPIVPSQTQANVLDGIATHSAFRSDAGYKLANLAIRGGIQYPRGDDIRVLAGTDFRGESLDTFEQAGDYSPPVWTSSRRRMTASYGEICLPLTPVVGHQCGDREHSIQNQVELIAADRYEHYDRFGGQAAPDLRLSWAALSGLSFEAGRRRAFKMPGLADLNESHNSSQIIPLSNPLSPSGVSPVLGWTGSNEDLHAQTAWTWTLSAAIRPPSLPALKVDVHAFHTDYRNRIEAPLFGADALTNPRDGDVVIPNPSTQQRARVCDSGQFIGIRTDCTNLPILAIVDGRLQNQARLVTSGVDLSIADAFESRFGKWSVGLSSTYLSTYVGTDPSGSNNLVNTPGNPPRLRMRGALSWSRGALQSMALVHYLGGYRDSVDQPVRDVRSWTTLDWQLGWKILLPKWGTYANALFSINVENVFNVDPPFVDSSLGIGYDTVNASDRGRVIMLSVSLQP